MPFPGTTLSGKRGVFKEFVTATALADMSAQSPFRDAESPSRDELASRYLDELPFDPFPVQEEALLAWFSTDDGVLVCAPTGMGKTVIAEAALFEALHTRRRAYYTTPLIALTEQKFREMQSAAVRWGFHADDVGLVTGNRAVNPDATVLVVVAEILLNRLLHKTAFDFSDVSAIVMDEFHSFNDPERGIVWELSLGLLPKHLRLLLLSATVGNSAEFLSWLRKSHGRKLQLVQSTDRRVPLQYEWVADELLNEQLEIMSQGDDEQRRTPALVFCFNREECWRVAEQMKGKHLLAEGQRQRLLTEVEKYDFTRGAGPKLKTVLLRGVGVHHAGLMPRYRRIVEELFQRKLLSICVCTETLAAGINLPARSVVLTTLMKGPPGKKRLIDPSAAHQMFGRAGRPQFDDRGYVYALAHEDDVKIGRWKVKYDQIPEDTKDPNLIKAKKKLKKKAPKRRDNEQYWNERQFQKLIESPPGKLASRGPLPWRLLAYLLQLSPEVERIREFVRKRLMDDKQLERGQRQLTEMLLTLEAGGFVTLEPPSPHSQSRTQRNGHQSEQGSGDSADSEQPQPGTLGALLHEARVEAGTVNKPKPSDTSQQHDGKRGEQSPGERYQPQSAHPTAELDKLLIFRSINPVYGAFLLEHLGLADRNERLQAFESVLETPGSMARSLRVPKYEELPPGPLARERLDALLLERGLIPAEQLQPRENAHELPPEERWVPKLADKLQLLFESEFPGVKDVRIRPVWAAGELLHFGGDFNKYVTSRDLTKQEGIVFRHLLRLILLCGEFVQLTPKDTTAEEWQSDLNDIAGMVTEACRHVDPHSTEKAIEAAQKSPDVVKGEATATEHSAPEQSEWDEKLEDFGSGLLDD